MGVAESLLLGSSAARLAGDRLRLYHTIAGRLRLPSAPQSPNENDRLRALHQYQILDTAPERAYDDIVELAGQICGTPIALVTLIDRDRQWFKSQLGITGSETPREEAFCAHTILGESLLVVPDALADARFVDNPSVVGDPHIRFYAGAPLLAAGGHALGSLCVVDTIPRSLSPAQLRALAALSRQVVANMELRRIAGMLAGALDTARTLSGLLPICAYCKRIRDDQDYWREVEVFVRAHAPVEFSHGICPRCVVAHFPDFTDGQPTPA